MKCKLNVGLQDLHPSGALTGGGRRRNGRHCPGVAYVESLFFEPFQQNICLKFTQTKPRSPLYSTKPAQNEAKTKPIEPNFRGAVTPYEANRSQEATAE